jgi:chromosome segregation ATPase
MLLFADNFLLDQEKRKNPVVFSAQPEQLTKDNLIYRMKIDEKGLTEYSQKISSLRRSLRRVQAKVSQLQTDNQAMQREKESYIEKIDKLSSKVAELEVTLTTIPSSQRDIYAAYNKLLLEYKRLDLSTALKGNEGYMVLQLEKENYLLKKELSKLSPEYRKQSKPRAYVESVWIEH